MRRATPALVLLALLGLAAPAAQAQEAAPAEAPEGAAAEAPEAAAAPEEEAAAAPAPEPNDLFELLDMVKHGLQVEQEENRRRVEAFQRAKQDQGRLLAESKATMPRRVRLETDDSIEPLVQLEGVRRSRSTDATGNPHDGEQRGPHWELELTDQIDPYLILENCFKLGIRLRHFDHSDPSLHEVFVHLVGPEAREVSYR